MVLPPLTYGFSVFVKTDVLKEYLWFHTKSWSPLRSSVRSRLAGLHARRNNGAF